MRLPSTLPSPDTSGWIVLIQPQQRDPAGNLLLPPLDLGAPERTEVDTQSGNLTWTFGHLDLPSALAGLVTRNPQQHRTRSGVYAVVADAGVGLVTATYRLGTNALPGSAGLTAGVLSLGSVGTDTARYSQTLTLLRCDVLYRRDGTTVTL